MQTSPPPILTIIEEFLGWTLDRTADFPKSHRFTFGQRMDLLMLAAVEHTVAARYDAWARPAELRALNLVLEKCRVLWRLVQARQWISQRQLLFAAQKLDEIGRMAGAWLKASEKKHP